MNDKVLLRMVQAAPTPIAADYLVRAVLNAKIFCLRSACSSGIID